MYTEYENFKELLKNEKELANELWQKFDSGEWQKETLYVYDTKEDFAKYELTNGWYFSLGLNLDSMDYHGAPNLLDYINLTELGDDLTNNWDESCYFLSKTGKIVLTNYGW